MLLHLGQPMHWHWGPRLLMRNGLLAEEGANGQLGNMDLVEKQLSSSILECAIPLRLPICHQTYAWISDECLDVVHEWKQAKHANFEKYWQLNREVRQKTKAD